MARKVNYINNKRFFSELSEWQDDVKRTGDENLQASDYLGECIMKLCDNIGHKYNFKNYTYLDEMKGLATVHAVKALKKFDTEKSDNPFAYFSQVIHRAFIQILKKEKKQQMIKIDMIERVLYMGTDYDGNDSVSDKLDKMM